MKTCTKCGETKPKVEFGKRRIAKDGMQPWCRNCRTANAVAWAKRNPERARQHSTEYFRRHKELCAHRNKDWKSRNTPKVRLYKRRSILSKYDMTIADYDSMLLSQDGKCAICRELPQEGSDRFHVDHDHKTGKVRGLLCSNCNVGIGNLKDNADTLRAAADYLENHEAGSNA